MKLLDLKYINRNINIDEYIEFRDYETFENDKYITFKVVKTNEVFDKPIPYKGEENENN